MNFEKLLRFFFKYFYQKYFKLKRKNNIIIDRILIIIMKEIKNLRNYYKNNLTYKNILY